MAKKLSKVVPVVDGLDMFKNAKIAPVSVKTTSAKADRDLIPVAGLKVAAACAEVTKALKGHLETYKSKCKAIAEETFKKMFEHSGAKPKSIDGFDDKATTQFVFGNSSTIPEKIVALMETHSVFFDKNEKEVVPERFVINPAITDQDMLRKIGEAIGKLNLGVDVILFQEASYKPKVTDQTYVDLAKVKDQAVRDEIYSSISTCSFKDPKFDDTSDSLQHAFDFLQSMGLVDIKKGKK